MRHPPRLAHEATHIKPMTQKLFGEQSDRKNKSHGGNASDNRVPRDDNKGTSRIVMMSLGSGENAQPSWLPWRQVEAQVDVVALMLDGFKFSNCVSRWRTMRIPNRRTRFSWQVGNDRRSIMGVVWCFRGMIKKGVGVSGLMLGVIVREGNGGVMAWLLPRFEKEFAA